MSAKPFFLIRTQRLIVLVAASVLLSSAWAQQRYLYNKLVVGPAHTLLLWLRAISMAMASRI